MRSIYRKAAGPIAKNVRAVRRRRVAPLLGGRFSRTPIARAPPRPRPARAAATAASVVTADTSCPYPTKKQLKAHFIKAAVPMIGFGFMDLTILLQAGNAIDCTFGVWFGLSTLSAAAFGSILSNMGSVVFGGVVERTAENLGLASANFSAVQKRLPVVRRADMYGTLSGIFLGCVLGLVNLLLIDTDKAQELKNECSVENEPYQIDVSNSKRKDATVVTIKGPDRDGLLAAIAKAFGEAEIRLLEVNAHPADESGYVEDVFVVQSKEKKQVSDHRLAQLVEVLSGGLVTE